MFRLSWKASTSDNPGGGPKILISDPSTPRPIKLSQIASFPLSFSESMVQILYMRDCDVKSSRDVAFKGDDEFPFAANFVVSFPVL